MPAGGLGGGLPLAGALHGGGGGPLLRPPHLPLQVGVHNDGTVSRIPRFDTSLIYTIFKAIMIFANQREVGFVDKHLNVDLVETTCLNTYEYH